MVPNEAVSGNVNICGQTLLLVNPEW